jgi:ribosomal protein S18 acetylase RimI-like enzyme
VAIEFRSLEGILFDDLFSAFRKAFNDYEIQVNSTQLAVLLHRRGFVPGLSFAAFEGEEIVAFTFNGIGEFNGIRTAYDTGTGTVPEYRGKGLASRVFEHSIPFLKSNNIQQYLLEVLQHNDKAVSVYRKLGFEVTREFNYFTQKKEAIQNQIKPGIQHETRPVTIEECEMAAHFCDFNPSWQNSFAAIYRDPDDFEAIGAYKDGQLIGFCIVEPYSGDITQLAVDHNFRRQGVASALFDKALPLIPLDTVKVVNTETTCTAITSFLESRNIPIRGKQFEMVMEL